MGIAMKYVSSLLCAIRGHTYRRVDRQTDRQTDTKITDLDNKKHDTDPWRYNTRVYVPDWPQKEIQEIFDLLILKTKNTEVIGLFS